MTVKEMMLKLLADAEAEGDSPDIDFCDDYDESAWCAYCGNHWSAEAEDYFKTAFGLEVYPYNDGDDCVLVRCNNDKEVNALHDLLYAMAGYIADDVYQRFFPEPEDEEPVPEHQPVEVVLRNGEGVMKAKRVEFEDGMLNLLGLDDEWRLVSPKNVLRIIGEV